VKHVAYHRLAANELLGAARLYDRHQPGLGDRFLAAVERTLAFIRDQPLLGVLEDQQRRSRPVARFPYRVVYELEPERIRLIAVAHMSRQPGYWKRRLN
jgi:plasmid stabilization system protein ParE